MTVEAYHPSIMQVIDLGDDMEFSKLPAEATADKLVCSDPTIPHDDRNLVIKVSKSIRTLVDAIIHHPCC